FFFQAEDGRRDATVTGVQTCALPISMTELSTARRRRFSGSPQTAVGAAPTRRAQLRHRAYFVPGCTPWTASLKGTSLTSSMRSRSEERRVGKECRYGWRGDE